MHLERERNYADTGFAPIDEEHRNISHLLNEVLTAVNHGAPDEIADALDAVLDVLVAHFRHEERLMADSAFANRARHQVAHDQFLVDVRRFRGVLALNGVTPDFRRWAFGRMREWFRFHVMANDVELGKHLVAWESAAQVHAQP